MLTITTGVTTPCCLVCARAFVSGNHSIHAIDSTDLSALGQASPKARTQVTRTTFPEYGSSALQCRPCIRPGFASSWMWCVSRGPALSTMCKAKALMGVRARRLARCHLQSIMCNAKLAGLWYTRIGVWQVMKPAKEFYSLVRGCVSFRGSDVQPRVRGGPPQPVQCARQGRSWLLHPPLRGRRSGGENIS